MKVIRSRLEIATLAIIINDCGVACTVGVGRFVDIGIIVVLIIFVAVKPVKLAAAVVVEERTELIWLSECELMIGKLYIASTLIIVLNHSKLT